MRRLIPLAAVAVLLAGCGGTSTYHAASTKACFAKDSGLRVSKRVDFVASTAPGGAFTVLLGDNQVTLSFADDEAGAKLLAAGYRAHRGKNIGIEDVLRPVRNVVALWVAHPSDADLGTVQRCLK